MSLNKVIISGGGTGGHIYPAIAIANKIRERNPNCEILFVGAEGKMEMEKVPKAGYEIVGLPIRGLQRKLTLKNLAVPFKLLSSLWKAKKIIKDFKPDAAIGVGGYASAAVLRKASGLKVPTLLQEQNSYPGVTNKILSKKAQKICVAYEGLEQFFPKEKIVLTGNPVRKEVADIAGKKEKALKHFGLKEGKRTILIIGGSLGARTLNESVKNRFEALKNADVQVIWQCGKYYFEDLKKFMAEYPNDNIYLSDFVYEMDLAYAAADVILSRAGALSISELCLIGKPAILVPSPNVSEDHQTKNAMALVNKNAAVLVKDSEAKDVLIPKAIELLNNYTDAKNLGEQIIKMGFPNAADLIVDEIEKLKKG